MEFTTVKKTAERWGVTASWVWKLCDDGCIPGVLRDGGHILIPVDAKRPVGKTKARKNGYISATKTAEKWDVSREFVCCAARGGRILGAEFIDGRWHIPEDAECPKDRRGKRKTHR